jgi:hypothetical protein
MKRRSRECVYVRGLLDAFVDDELTKRECARVTVHLPRCSVCTEELLNIRNLIRMLATMPAVMPEHDLESKMEQAVTAVWTAQRNAHWPVRTSMLTYKPAAADAVNTLWVRPWKCAACMSAAAVFALGFWTSWSAPEQLLNLFQTTKIKDVLVPSDCYVAHVVDVGNANNDDGDAVSNAALDFHDDEGSSSLTEEIGLKTDEDGLYAVEM